MKEWLSFTDLNFQLFPSIYFPYFYYIYKHGFPNLFNSINPTALTLILPLFFNFIHIFLKVN